MFYYICDRKEYLILENMRTLKNIVSLSVGILILSLPFNPVKDIPDKIHLSFLFVCIFLSGIAGISATCLPAKEAGSRLTVVDLWVAGCCSAWIAVMVVVVFSACKRFDIPLRWKMAGCVVLVLFMGWLYHFKAASADGRLLIWKVTMQMVKEKPLAGFGSHGFRAEES